MLANRRGLSQSEQPGMRSASGARSEYDRVVVVMSCLLFAEPGQLR